ncbi:BREX-1 system adenine-specific DNA-methyltransferase PglX [Calditerrivibrio nitroreducens]|uniref:site-specific DNA-methyltransferase (adenine-specific) n=1 Tax=Calditerrivibrio nitroreducens (strain DSM 19672 / NBRC 101217 / Yu37-1) TaxID=768670 RepID=E4THQ9_CALNY|nr:BREX-1 system adenine-specific DNA-methyltransferase PglX [Calditerrivibrio nitroreducens]ADR19920.1 putative restriction enzyme [Calditerrivibrio nitroreducens DSM 19672]
MDTGEIKKFAVRSRQLFVEQVKVKAALLGFSEKGITEYREVKNEVIVNERVYPRKQWKEIERIVKKGKNSYLNLIDEVAYTWFNRFVALKFMEENGYISHRFVKSSSEKWYPDVLNSPELTGILDKNEIIQLRLNNEYEKLYKKLLIAHCNNLNKAMPFIFEEIDDYTELLLSDLLLSSKSIIAHIDKGLPAEFWKDVEIIGWIYQFYISEKKDQVIGSKKAYKKEDIPAATQLFTPRWIVDYLVQNSVGRIWMESYPKSILKDRMKYYVESDVDVEKKFYLNLNPENLMIIDPACGSGHILIRVFDILMNIYREMGYSDLDAVRNIVEKNLYGLDIDKRAVQLACFAVMMKAREYGGSKVLSQKFDLNIYEIQEVDENLITSTEFIKGLSKEEDGELQEILSIFVEAKNFGSLITIPDRYIEKLDYYLDLLSKQLNDDFDLTRKYASKYYQILKIAKILGQKYDAMIANPPYMGNRFHNDILKKFLQNNYPESKSDLFAAFIERGFEFLKDGGFEAMITMQSWMFLSRYEKLRKKILKKYQIVNMVHLGTRAFPEIGGEVVQNTAFVIRNCNPGDILE